MRLINITKNTTLAQDVYLAKTVFSRIKGLLGRKIFPPGQAVILDPCDAVHTFFMHFAIDILFIGKDYKVIKTIASLKPNQATFICWRSRRVIELPAGTLKLTNTQAGDQLQLLE